MEHDPILSIQSLSISFNTPNGSQLVVHELDLEIQRGETFVLLGESGCGKSVTAHSIPQLLSDSAEIAADSKIIFDGIDLLNCAESKLRSIRGKQIGMIFQEPMTALNPVMSIGSQINEMLLSRKHMSPASCKKHSIALLEEVGIDDPHNRYDQFPHQLSGGQKQRVIIAIALAGKPKLLIADEPTTALDVTTQSQILYLLKRLQRKFGLSILLITHDIGVARLMGDVTGVMFAGYLVETNTMQNLINNAMHPYTQELLAAIPSFDKNEKALNVTEMVIPKIVDTNQLCRYYDRCPLRIDVCKRLAPNWYENNSNVVRCHLYNDDFISVKTISLKEEENQFLKSGFDVHENENVLDIKNLKVYFPIVKGIFKRVVQTIKAVDEISFSVDKGKTLAIVGESGSGKTTAGRAIIDLIKRDCGSIKINGIRLSKIHQKFRRRIQMIFQDVYSSIDPKLTMRDIILEGLLLVDKSPNSIERKLSEVLMQVGLERNMLSRYPHQFSGGQRQRIAIARSLILSPDILILDEPTSALDVSIQAHILNLLKTIQKESYLSYVLISHDISVVSYMADEIAVMYLGKIVEYGKTKDILTNPQHPYTKLLLNSIPENINFDKMAMDNNILNIPQNVGCSFLTRCSVMKQCCKTTYPETIKITDTHQVRCFKYDKKAH